MQARDVPSIYSSAHKLLEPFAQMSQRISLATPDPQFREILSTLPKDAPQVTGISQVRQGFVDGAIKPQQESLRPHLPPGILELYLVSVLEACTHIL